MKRLIATPEGAGQWSGNPAFRTVLANIVTPATRYEDRCAAFHPMDGYTIAQTVAMKIEGVHRPLEGAHDTRKTPMHTYAVY